MSTVLAKVETIGEADMKCLVETTDVTYLVRDACVAEVLKNHVGRSTVFYIPEDVGDTREIYRIAGLESKSYVLIGNFTQQEIYYIKSRCRSR